MDCPTDDLLAARPRWPGGRASRQRRPSCSARACRRPPATGLDRARLEHELGEALWAAGDPAASLAAYERSEAAWPSRPEPGEPALRARVLDSGDGARAGDDRVSTNAAAEAAGRAIALAEESGRHARRAAGPHHAGHRGRPAGRARDGRRHSCASACPRPLPPTPSRPSCAASATSPSSTRPRADWARCWRSRRRARRYLPSASDRCCSWRPRSPRTGSTRWLRPVAGTRPSELAHGAAAAVGRRGHGAGPAPRSSPRSPRLAVTPPSFERRCRSSSGSRVRTTRTRCTTSPRRARSTCSGRDDAEEAHRITRESLGQLADQQDAGLVVSMCSLALRAHADLVTAGPIES